MKFTIDVEHAAIPTQPTYTGNPSPTAQLATSFALDNTDPLVSVHAVQDWQCKGTQLRTP